MRIRLQLASLLVLLCAACAKKEVANPVQNELPPVASSNTAATHANQAVDVGPLLTELTQTVRRFGVEQRQVPKSLQEVVDKGYLPAAPAPPPGKKFAINQNLEVYLADQ